MGNPVLDGRAFAVSSGCTITKFYTSTAWIDGRAERQLEHVAGWRGVRNIAAFPDLHLGKFGPVGCAVLADRIYPQLIGNDIGCGMSLFQLDIPLRRLKLEKALRRIRVLGEPTTTDHAPRLEDIGLHPDLFTTSLGTIGGGNHFCEVQTIVESASELGLDKTLLLLLVHSGSRGLGNAVLDAVPKGAFSGLPTDSDAAQVYVQGHNSAIRWASLNRQIIAGRAAEALRADVRLIVDVPHNLLTKLDGGWLHRKGAADATSGLVPLAGSRATPSFLLRPTGDPNAMSSTAHGAGRRYDRSSMRGRVRSKRSDLTAMQRNPFGGRIICEDRDLLVKEAPLAYKSPHAVVADLETTGAATPIATCHPLLTFKKIRNGGRS